LKKQHQKQKMHRRPLHNIFSLFFAGNDIRKRTRLRFYSSCIHLRSEGTVDWKCISTYKNELFKDMLLAFHSSFFTANFAEGRCKGRKKILQI